MRGDKQWAVPLTGLAFVVSVMAGFLVLGQQLAVLDVVAILFVVVASAGATASVRSWTPSPSATAA